MRQAFRDWHEGQRGTAIKGFFKREWPVIAWAVSFTLIAIGIFQVDDFGDKLRDSAVSGCERQNEVRQALRQQFTLEIKESRDIPSEFFPAVPQQQLQELIRDGIERLREQRTRIPLVPCEELYPE
jgi:hypothetical protein